MILDGFGAFVSVVVIDIVLAGDNAVIVGMAASGFEPRRRRKIILWGTLAATVLRIGMATIVVQLLAIIGLTLAGGILLLWVAWKFYRDLAAHQAAEPTEPAARPKGIGQAIARVALADLSMSLDNVLAVAGTARDHIWVLVSGLTLSVALMGIASELMARLIARYRWIAWVGLGIVTFVALRMIYEGSEEVATSLSLALGLSRNCVS
ncbi:MAG TPA: TerC family protein [Stellaceae bacterium]|nr:TerC family protein [Stellaceae bacterium]